MQKSELETEMPQMGGSGNLGLRMYETRKKGTHVE